MSALSAVVLLVFAAVNDGWESMEGRVISGHPESKLQAVAKPIVPEGAAQESQQPESHTVFQNPQQLDLQGLQQGFGQGTTPQSVTSNQGPLREFAQNLGEATRQSFNDLGDGVKGVYDGAAEGVRSTADALGNVGRNTVNAGNPDYFAGRRAASEARSVPPPDWTGNQTPQQAPQQAGPLQPQPLARTQFEADPFDNSLPNAQANPQRNTGVSPTGGQIATSFSDEEDDGRYPGQSFQDPNYQAQGAGQAAGQNLQFDPGYRRSQLAPVNSNQFQGNQFQGNQQPNGFAGNGQNQQQSQMGAGYNYNRNPNFNTTAAQQPNGAQAPWPNPAAQQQLPAPLLAPPLNAGPQTASNGYQQNPSQASDWPAPNRQAPTQPYQPQRQQPRVQTAGIGGGGGGESWTNLQELGTNPAGNETQTISNAQENSQANTPGNPDAWLFAFLIASWAITIYVGMTYLDIRNKYRAVLRRNPAAYNVAA